MTCQIKGYCVFKERGGGGGGGERGVIILTLWGTYPLILACLRHDPGAEKLSCLLLQLSLLLYTILIKRILRIPLQTEQFNSFVKF
jgi:hypothetical protein